MFILLLDPPSVNHIMTVNPHDDDIRWVISVQFKICGCGVCEKLRLRERCPL